MQIHRMYVAINELDRIEDGAVLSFERDVSLLDEGDALVARLTGGEERLLIVRRAYPGSWLVEHQAGSKTICIRLQQIDERSLRVVLDPHQKLVPEVL